MVFLVVFHLDPKSESYALLSQKLADYPDSYHAFDSVWLISDTRFKKATQISEELAPFFGKEDSVFIATLDDCDGKLTADNWDWLRGRLAAR
jgi:hypothetical protein